MKPKFVIIGQSPAAYSAIKTMRDGAADWDIALISTDGQLPYSCELFPELINRAIKEKDVFCAAGSFYKENGIEVVLDKEISRINFNRRKVYLSEKAQLDYDALLITDVPQVRLPEVKGSRRQGVFHTARLDSVRRIIKQLTFVETVVVVPSTLYGMQIARALKEAGKEVVVVSAERGFLPFEFMDATEEVLSKGIEAGGLRLIVNTLEDVLGEGEVQAVRFKSGKVMACEMVIFEDVQPDLRFLAEGDLVIRKRVCVHSTMRSNIDNVYAADVLMELSAPEFIGSYSMNRELSMRQGECAVSSILGAEEHFVPPVPEPVHSTDAALLVEALPER